MYKGLIKRFLARVLVFAMMFQTLPTNLLAALAEGDDGGWLQAVSNDVGNEQAYTVTFKSDTDTLTQIVVEGGTLTVMPEKPFKAGYRFAGWNTKADGTGNVVTKGYAVTGDMDVYAVFEKISVYEVAVDYWYKKSSGEKYIFDTQVFEFEAKAVPYTITPPKQVSQDSAHTGDEDNPIYYPSKPTITITDADLAGAVFDEQRDVYVLPRLDVEYVPFTATYDFVYYLKNLSGSGYTEIERETVEGVKGSTVTPTVKTYDYADFERTAPVYIDQASGQELPVYYTRKEKKLTYDSQGGSYVAPYTGVYGESVEISSAKPTRTGYDFAGWFTEPEGGEKVSGNLTLEEDVTLYAHWTGKTVNYTIVYMFEKYDDTGKNASYVYDNSEKGSGTVGTTVRASSAPTKTRTGSETPVLPVGEPTARRRIQYSVSGSRPEIVAVWPILVELNVPTVSEEP